ncbi:MAG: hypothetical protein CMJ40_04265 [Phycisphaerae bacterium]|nr:hypothetical protein [Phycisphaerae bacterium]|tara:strand:+ start:890 stop:1681 length:792 start_codon:yes stop_codon:yes gene_type:complete
MSQMPREPEAFSEQVLRILKRLCPESDASLSGPMDLIYNGRQLALNNLYRMVCCDPDRGVEIVDEFLDRMAEGDSIGSSVMPLELARTRVMPRIQPESIFERLDRQQVAHMPFVNGTVIVFVLDMPRLTVSITTEQMLRWGVTVDDLDGWSRENLQVYTPDLKVQFIEGDDGGRAAVFSVQDGYDAARLLLGSLHERLAPELHGDFFVATPARDLFVALSIAPDAFVERLRKRANRDFRRLPYPITDDFFVVTRDGVAGTRAA